MSTQTTETVARGALRPATVRVWDPLVRTFHWLLVGLFTFAFLTGDEWDTAHETAGYAIAVLVALRIIWGFTGTRHARFADFVRSPPVALAYLGDSLRMRAKRYLGHNPAGGWMILALLLAISVICISGYMMTTDAFWGVEWVEEIHEAAAYGALVLIAFHILGVLFASFEHRENLVKAMFTGRKRP